MNDLNGSILIAKDGRVVFNKSYGLANRELRVGIDANTKFRIGSISKQFTAAAILLLQERNALHLADPISKFISGFPSGERITLQTLLIHTSGVPRDLPDHRNFSKVGHSIRQLVDIVKSLPLDFEPGAKYQYSNLGYLLLADVVEEASGRDYGTFLKDNIFVPLSMNETGVDRQDEILEHRASGYQTGVGTELINAQFEDMSSEAGYGSLYSTVEDLLKWEKAWNTDQVLRKSSWAQMFQDYGHGYGFAVSVDKLFGHTVMGHDGSVNGFNAFVRSFPDQRVCIIYVGNIESGALLKLPDDLAAIIFGERYEIPPLRPPHVALKQAQLLPYVGSYLLFPGFPLDTELQGNELYLRGGGSGEEYLALTPLSDSHFFYRHLYGDITFVKDPTGQVTEMVWRWGGSGGKEYHCKKTR